MRELILDSEIDRRIGIVGYNFAFILEIGIGCPHRCLKNIEIGLRVLNSR